MSELITDQEFIEMIDPMFSDDWYGEPFQDVSFCKDLIKQSVKAINQRHEERLRKAYLAGANEPTSFEEWYNEKYGNDE